MKNYDLLVIGGGAGISIVDAAMQAGLKCALVEKSKMGGTCLTKGCIPSKVLVHVADMKREVDHAVKTGFHAESTSIDWEMVSARVWKKIDQSQALENKLLKAELLDLYKGTARFVEKRVVEVELEAGGSELMQADKIVIAAGARSFILPISGLMDTGFLTPESFFGPMYPKQPYRSLAIIGGGAIGLEFAHIFSAMGTEVTIVEMQPRLAVQEEPEVSALLRRQMENNNIKVYTDSRVIAAEVADDDKILTLSRPDGQTIQVKAQEILLAAGVRSNSDLLHLEHTGIETDARGWIVTNEYLETTQENVWAVGDINGKYQFRHKANYEVEVLVHNLFSGQTGRRKARYDVVPWAIFTWPQIAHVGLTEEQAVQRGHKVLAGVNPYSAVANGYALGYERGDADDGFVKLITDEKLKILGAHIVGPQASILIQPYVYLMNAGAGCQEQDINMPHGQIIDGQSFEQTKKLRPGICLEANTTAAIDQAMIIHPALSEVAGWVTGELEEAGS